MSPFPKFSFAVLWCYYQEDGYGKKNQTKDSSPCVYITQAWEVIHCCCLTYIRRELNILPWILSLILEKHDTRTNDIPDLQISDVGKRFDLNASISQSENLGKRKKGEYG
jgi:hypothetical protein